MATDTRTQLPAIRTHRCDNVTYITHIRGTLFTSELAAQQLENTYDNQRVWDWQQKKLVDVSCAKFARVSFRTLLRTMKHTRMARPAERSDVMVIARRMLREHRVATRANKATKPPTRIVLAPFDVPSHGLYVYRTRWVNGAQVAIDVTPFDADRLVSVYTARLVYRVP